VCGITITYAFGAGAPDVDDDELQRTAEAMRRRGPDGAGSWRSRDGRVGMAHRRLAIIDLSAEAAQPMISGDGRLVIVFNGEIYNHRELRAELEADGARFRTHSDTEVLLQLFERRGASMLDALRGMFAFAIWDGQERRLFAARDPYGIKPFYYSTAGGVFRAASQVKALLAGGGVSAAPDPAGLTGFLLRGVVPEPFTTVRDVQALPAGSSIFVDARGASEPRRFFSIAAELARGAQLPAPAEERAAIVREALRESVRHHLVSDVPVGVFLSAGRDSTTIAGMARELGAPLHAVTVGFEEYRDHRADEVPLAREVARSLGISHSVVTLGRDEFHRELPRALEAMDQPSIDGLNSYFVSRAAAQAGMKVALSGTGGDELFGGYSTFRRIPRTVRAASPFRRFSRMGRAFRMLHRAVVPANQRISPRGAGILEYGGTYEGAYLLRRGVFMPWELPSIIGRELAEEGLRRLDLLGRLRGALEPDPGTPHARVIAMESEFFLREQLLRDIDWASMDHSLEVRVPLVDVGFLRAIAPVIARSAGEGKELLLRSLKTPLPPEVATRRKSGFTLPIRSWLFQEQTRMFGNREWALELYAGVAPLDRAAIGARVPMAG
jgi:asparagine synthase (glutamine-hydrolysing)